MRFVLLLLCLLVFSFRPDKPAYRLYDPNLKAATYDKLLRRAADADVVLFGELHNNPICHWLELQLTKDLQARKKGALVLGAEMFEADNQTALTDYVQGRTTGKELATQARLWPNFDTDYKPITDFAREQKIPFIATNVPRRYASLVARQGLTALDTLSTEAKGQMAPLPLTVDLTLPGYKAMLDMMNGSAHSGSKGTASNPHQGSTDQAANFARAQAIKDATMAYFILQNLKPGQTMLHLNGDYHSKNFEGIVWYLRQQRPDLNVVTLSSVELLDTEKPTSENRNLADFVLAIPADMTKTY
ncbi:ChaN family lipoprotein [Spirosoma taeanense]|uniref:ChaN family lipoprotein n=1 Tax=Spirosoma taeanense TaxID=2735870 RepID=A0A6M5Y0S4_9BACT|nr:ChaN family lipoprotein [Spirosoma taeanense]QJW88378.1 ChaN family lipoprotein [Spirosoma taeanense]